MCLRYFLAWIYSKLNAGPISWPDCNFKTLLGGKDRERQSCSIFWDLTCRRLEFRRALRQIFPVKNKLKGPFEVIWSLQGTCLHEGKRLCHWKKVEELLKMGTMRCSINPFKHTDCGCCTKIQSQALFSVSGISMLRILIFSSTDSQTLGRATWCYVLLCSWISERAFPGFCQKRSAFVGFFHSKSCWTSPPKVMEGLNRYYSMIYIADFIVINRRDFQDHLRVLFQGMTRIQKYGGREVSIRLDLWPKPSFLDSSTFGLVVQRKVSKWILVNDSFHSNWSLSVFKTSLAVSLPQAI